MVIFSSIDYQVHSNVGFYIWELSLHGTFHSSLLRIYCIFMVPESCISFSNIYSTGDIDIIITSPDTLTFSAEIVRGYLI